FESTLAALMAPEAAPEVRLAKVLT
ncbi:MAG: hypothetical protein QOH13_821, partial [Thermoleophilaceae bacterium]|nr:hypothetical protein [Thermoleophilaceae bacterium]